ncbi:DUF202 domain-containing protein [Streptomyces sp. NPDC007984]|uniref:DUF202 domain-containing protein n=1 Tax=Streptomyces sp. NPDC007984 TaxID=3364801 RepID=UPI0036F10A66
MRAPRPSDPGLSDRGAGGSRPPDGGLRDPGLQPERTRLAWRRTTLACTVVAGLAGRQAVHEGVTAPRAVTVALSALLWLGFLAVAHRRIRALTAARPVPLARRAAVAAAACVMVLAWLALAAAF